MPTPKQWEDAAAKQRAYRDRQRAARAEEQAAKGLPALPKIATLPGTARWRGLIESARAALETTREEMEAYHVERSERWKETERAGEMAEQIEALETIIEEIQGLSV